MRGEEGGTAFKWLVGIVTTLLVGLGGHALGYERAISRVDEVAADIGVAQKEIVELRTSHRGLSYSVERTDAMTTRRLDKIDERLEAIWQELRRLR